MKKLSCLMMCLVLTVVLPALSWAGDETVTEESESENQGTLKGSLTAVPVDYSFVHGDQAKYREQQWSRDGYLGGIEDFNLTEADHIDGLSAEMSGHAIPRDNDYEANVRIDKKDVGYLIFDYQEFSKYFDDTGAYYYPHRVLQSVNIGRDHELQIGHFGIEAGLTFEDLPKVVFIYNRHFKDGTKSRLNYGVARENSVNRGIVPTFQNLDEIVDTVELQESYTFKGIELNGTQHWEWMHADASRLEVNLSTDGVAANNKQRRQEQKPQSKLFSVTQTAERWNKKETVFTGVAYHYLSVEASELESIFEMDASGNSVSFANPKQIRNARADNEYDSHAWVTSVLVSPFSWLTAISKVRGELMNRSGNSDYPSDSTNPPDGIINTREVNQTEDRVGRIGEGLSLRTQLPFGAALYNDFELEQIRNWLSEDRDSLAGQSAASAGEIFGRETIVHSRRGSWNIGLHMSPWHWVDTTANYRHTRHNNDYDDKRETISTATGAKSAFFEELNIATQELAYRITLKPNPRVRPSFRYTLRLRDYMPRVESEKNTNSRQDSHIFTADLTVQPIDRMLLITGFSFENFIIQTPGRDLASYLASWHGNSVVWMNSVSYDITQRLNLTGGLNVQRADNFHDFAIDGLPLGISYRQLDLNAALRWKVNETVSVVTEYGYFFNLPFAGTDTGSYDANAIAVKTVLNWG